MRRILFVDDEPAILSGLKRTLRPWVGKWEMVFVTNGQTALDALHVAPFDVLVTDMRMPEMDGAQLLSTVHKHYPTTTRIVLSGYAELEATLRAVPVAHQFLAKPCDSQVLVETIERACALQALLLQPELAAVAGAIKSLPTCPKAYMALKQAMARPDYRVKDLALIIQRDIAMTAKVLQLVNSSFFGLPRRIASVEAAVNYLGCNTLSSLILGLETFAPFADQPLPCGFSFELLHRHAQFSAALAQRILPEKLHSEFAYTASMLSDIGLLILATKKQELFQGLFQSAVTENSSLHQLEQNAWGVSHAEVGAYLLGLWGLPYPIIEAVAHHHQPQRVQHAQFGVLDAVHVANALTFEVCPRAELRPLYVQLDMPLLRLLGIDDARMAEWRTHATSFADSLVEP